MADEPIPEDLREFILKHIDSIAQIEALMLLRRDPGTPWNAVTVARQLYTTEKEAAAVLARLSADGFAAASESSYRYESRSAELAAMVDRLAGLYSHQLIPVTNLIHAKPRRIREFADAFKLRKET